MTSGSFWWDTEIIYSSAVAQLVTVKIADSRQKSHNCSTDTGVKDDSHLILSNGLINQAKRLDRMVHAFSQILTRHPNTFFLILGREHPSEPLAGKHALVSIWKVYLALSQAAFECIGALQPYSHAKLDKKLKAEIDQHHAHRKTHEKFTGLSNSARGKGQNYLAGQLCAH